MDDNTSLVLVALFGLIFLLFLLWTLTRPSGQDRESTLDTVEPPPAKGPIGPTDPAEQLMMLLRADTASVRDGARASLLSLGPAAVPALVGGLNHAEPSVGIVSAEVLGELKQPEAIQPLILTLKVAARPVQLAARRGLILLGPQAIPALEETRNECNGPAEVWIRRQIDEILAEINAGAARS